MRSAERAVLDRLVATGALQPSDLEAALDATIRPAPAAGKHDAATARAGKSAMTATTGPFLPSITLAEPGTSTTAGPASADLLVTALLGEGGMGVVHMASQRSLDRSVAIKRPTTESGDALVDEARVMARVEHPNVAPVYALGRDANDRPVLVMKRVQGASFRELLKDEAHAAWPPLVTRWGDRERAALGILGEVADALELAHARRIVHRDVKPENVMVGEFGEVYLLDWGIARRLDEPESATGDIVGTPGYMAPEMVLAPDTVDARTDVYLLGATLHEVLTKTLRHRGSSLYETLGMALASEPVAYGTDVPEDLAALANAATSLDRDARPQSAAAFRRALRDHERHREALELVRDAREALAPLADRSLALADPGALPRLSEAGASIAAALRAFPESVVVRAARTEHAVLSIERDLALESPGAARAHLAGLPSPRPDLEQRIEALETRLARAKASEAALAAAHAESDTSSTLRARTLMLAAAFLPVVLATVLVRTTGLFGGATLTAENMRWTDAGLVGLLLVAMFVGRKRLFGNRANRMLSWLGALGALSLPASNTLGLFFGEPPAEVLAHTYVMVGYAFAAAAFYLHPRFALGAVAALATAWLLAVYPDRAALLSTTGMIGNIAVLIGGVIAYGERRAA